MVYNFPLYISSIHKHNINLVNKDHNFMWDYYHTSLNNTIQSVSIGEVQIPQPHYQIIKLGLQSWWNSNKTKLEITKAVPTIQKLDNQSKKYKILPIYKQFFFLSNPITIKLWENPIQNLRLQEEPTKWTHNLNKNT